MTRETLDLAAAHVRFAANEHEGVIEGYAALFNELVPSYGEKIARGAFKASLAAHKLAGTKPVMLAGHRDDAIIGVWDLVAEDDLGLKVRGPIIRETARGAEMFALLRAGAINGLSIGFTTKRADFDKDGVRILREIDLLEISVVAFPASPKARISNVRSNRPIAVTPLIEAARRAAKALS